MRMVWVAGLLVAVAGTAVAQENARQVREQSLQASRYELLLGKLQDQNEQLMQQVRALQKANDALAKDVQASSAKSQNVADEMQRLKNTQLQNISAAQKQLADKVSTAYDKMPWGEGQRDCNEINTKHQQLKLTMKPDGTRSVRFLCFDGKALFLGSELYTVNE
jgi:uncharacterized protein YoxC